MKRAAGKSKLEKHVAFTGTLLPVVLIGAALISLAASIWTRHHTLTALATWFTLQSLLFFETRFQSTHPDTDLTGSSVELPRLYGSAIALWLLLTATFGLGYRPPRSSSIDTANGTRSRCSCGALWLCIFSFAIPQSEAL